MQISIGFSRAKNWWLLGSQAISIAEKRPYSHCYIRYTCPITRIELVAQASHGCVNLMNFELFKQNSVVVEEYEFKISDNQLKHMLCYINNNLGVKYSKLQIMLLAIKKLLHIEVNIHTKDETFICSELASRVCEVLGILTVVDQDYVTPSDLNKLIKEKINK